MEQEIYCKPERNRKKDCFCSWIFVAVVAIVLSFFIGVLISALTTIITTLTVGSIIALVVAFAVLFILSIIGVICCKKNDDKDKYCC